MTNLRHLRQRLWLWIVVRLGTRDCGPGQLLRLWLTIGGVWIVATVGAAVDGVCKEHPPSTLFVGICVLGLVPGIVVSAMAIADLCLPRVIEGRVTDCRLLCVKRVTGSTIQRYGYRITIVDGAGRETIVRGPAPSRLDCYPERTMRFISAAHRSEYPDGDAVRAEIGRCLRWLFQLEPIAASTPSPAIEQAAGSPADPAA